MIEAVILAKFKKGPGRIKVHSGDYELFDRRTGRSVSESNFVGLIPGSNISMAMIIGRYRVDGLVPDGCTRMGCRSSQIRVINPETTTWYVFLISSIGARSGPKNSDLIECPTRRGTFKKSND